MYMKIKTILFLYYSWFHLFHPLYFQCQIKKFNQMEILTELNEEKPPGKTSSVPEALTDAVA